MNEYIGLLCFICQREFSMKGNSSIHFIEIDGKKLMVCTRCYKHVLSFIEEIRNNHEAITHETDN